MLTPLEHIDDANVVVLPDHPVVDGRFVFLPVLRFAVVPG